eukprot:TRINITY_DN8080_c0_g1_i1.p1 TRINITY_DN8080_c0_g1~~TRINITY_DN8080_c0_g1_i1.p1  ORF type:complete len:365 (+),score=22.01 TRINITY_DN8080_c0_g1_i1:54-1097(+)
MEGTSVSYLLSLLLLSFGLSATLAGAEQIGVCYGDAATNMPTPAQVVNLLQSKKIGKIRFYDSNHNMQNALKGTEIEVTLGVKNQNDELKNVASSQAAADGWVKDNVKQFINQNVNIKYIAVGNEVFRDSSLVQYLVPAMKNIQTAINNANLQSSVKVSTPHATDVLDVSSPPSKGTFKNDVKDNMRQILQLLKDNGAPFMAHIYPYFSYTGDKSISIEYALFTAQNTVTSDGSRNYKNLFDAIHDALVAAMADLGFSDISILVTESGWPSSNGDSATVANARTYNNNLIKHVLSNDGTPARPGKVIPTYVFELFNENQKGNQDDVERHFGLFNTDLSPAYSVNFSP